MFLGKRTESLSEKIDADLELHWVVFCETDTWEYRLIRIRIDIDDGICNEPSVQDWVEPGLVLV